MSKKDQIMKKIAVILIILFISCISRAQQQNQTQFNLEEFEIIHLSSGVAGETNIKTQPQPAQQSQALSREEREQAMRRLREIRTAMRKIEDETSQQNSELKAIMDKINQLQKKRKSLIDEILADNFEYQQLKQKIASGDYQASDTMRLASFERQAAQDPKIREIDRQIRELQQQRQTLLQTVLKDNQEYQSQNAESQSIMQGFRASFSSTVSPGTPAMQVYGSGSGGSGAQIQVQQPSSSDSGPRWRRNTDTETGAAGERLSGGQPWRGRSGGRN